MAEMGRKRGRIGWRGAAMARTMQELASVAEIGDDALGSHTVRGSSKGRRAPLLSKGSPAQVAHQRFDGDPATSRSQL